MLYLLLSVQKSHENLVRVIDANIQAYYLLGMYWKVGGWIEVSSLSVENSNRIY